MMLGVRNSYKNLVMYNTSEIKFSGRDEMGLSEQFPPKSI